MLTASGSPSFQTHQTLAPARGVTPPPQDGATFRFLSDVIMARGLVEPATMKAALQASLAGRSLSDILLERNALSDLDLARAVAEHHRLDHVDLDEFDVDHSAAKLVDAAMARRLGAVPIAVLPGGELAVAVHDPNGTPALGELSQLVDLPIQPAVASRTQIEALIGVLDPFAQLGPAQPAAPAAAVAAPEKHLRAVPAADAPAVSAHPADLLRPTVPAAVALPPTPMQTRNENDERARAAEELSRAAESRAHAAEERADKAEKMIAAANSRAEGLMAAATAANEALARLVGNCEVLERDAKAREGEMQALRSELGSERAERVRLESEPQAGDELLALHVRIAELERELSEQRAAVAIATPAPETSSAPPAPPSPEPPAAAIAPQPVAVMPPPASAVVEAPAREVAVVPAAVVEPEPVPVRRPPAVELTIDIVGEPGVPYVSALAPMPPLASASARTKNPKAAAKARGLRRLIGALKRG